MISTERVKACKFQEGLVPYQQQKLAPPMIEDYAEIYERALVIKQTSQRLAFDRQQQ